MKAKLILYDTKLVGYRTSAVDIYSEPSLVPPPEPTREWLQVQSMRKEAQEILNSK